MKLLGLKNGEAARSPETDVTPPVLSLRALNFASPQVYVPSGLFLACLAAQLYLIFFKSFNWDEFLHISQVYQLKAGTLSQSFQVLHSRILWWVPSVSSDLLYQLTAARIFAWAMHLLTLFAIYGVARRFTTASNAFFSAFAYLTAGFVFKHGFSVRADPMVAATLMSGLYLMVSKRVSLLRAIVVGALVGLAGMMTLKAIFYAPCFAGLAWLQFRQEPQKLRYVGRLAAMAIAAFLTFAAIYLYHTADLAEAVKSPNNGSMVSHLLGWVLAGRPFAAYIGHAIILAPLFFVAIILAPRGWKSSGLEFDARIALAGFIAPLAVLLFYRNTFPYFFVFLLAPVAVAIAPALGLVRDRYGSIFVSIVLSAVPLALTILEPRDVRIHQRAMIDYVHREFPEKTGYLDYSGMISDYPRIINHLTSGIGIASYYRRGNAIVGREIDRGNVPFMIANQEVIAGALEGRPMPYTFLPNDLAAMQGNYVRQWGLLWREGRQIPAGPGPSQFQLRRDGTFVLDGATVTVDGVAVRHGERIKLDRGSHLVGGDRKGPTTLWRGDRLPSPPPSPPMDRLFTTF